jgi:hypothetical protein
MIADTFTGNVGAVTLTFDDYKPLPVVTYHWQIGATEPDEDAPLWERRRGKIIARYTKWELDLCLQLVADPERDVEELR